MLMAENPSTGPMPLADDSSKVKDTKLREMVRIGPAWSSSRRVSTKPMIA